MLCKFHNTVLDGNLINAKSYKFIDHSKPREPKKGKGIQDKTPTVLMFSNITLFSYTGLLSSFDWSLDRQFFHTEQYQTLQLKVKQLFFAAKTKMLTLACGFFCDLGECKHPLQPCKSYLKLPSFNWLKCK